MYGRGWCFSKTKKVRRWASRITCGFGLTPWWIGCEDALWATYPTDTILKLYTCQLEEREGAPLHLSSEDAEVWSA